MRQTEVPEEICPARPRAERIFFFGLPDDRVDYGRMKAKGIVYLVGAGPGDAGLLTLRGAELLARADVVVYDGLVNLELLRFAPKGAEKIFGGKRPKER